MKLLLKLKKCWPVFFLLFLEVVLFILNYRKGTFLVGWDNLFPELNFKANFQRNIFSLWQEYRGLGLLDGMSYAANLPHTIFIFLLSTILPQNLIRYLFVFLMHFLGGVGIYLLSEKLFKDKISSLAASIFYLLSLATMQTFYVPFELFTVHFAFLPILIHLCLKFLDSGSKKDLIAFTLMSVLSWPQAHVPTLFIVYFLALVTFVVFSFGMELKRKIFIILVTLSVNTPWMFPYVYSAIGSAQTISNSKINISSSEDIYLKNKAFGDFTDTVLLKGYELDTVEIQQNKSNGFMMADWRSHSQKVLFKIIGFCFFGISLLGFVSVLVKKQKTVYPVLALFLISFVMLGQDIPVLNLISQFLNNHIPLFKQVFRFTFTKFSILFAFSFAILLGNGFLFVFENRSKLIKAILAGVFIASILFYSGPAWQGKFIYDNLRLKIPNEYFETINFFKESDKNTRVATLPQPSFWGWTYTNWGLRGSGFQWFGIPQPTLDGAFLPWSRENENYYWEISYAIYSKNKDLFEKVLEKYQVNWLLIDGNVINPGSSKAVFLDELGALLNCQLPTTSCQPSKFELVETFGKIKIYKVNLETSVKDFVWITNNLPNINQYQWSNYDRAYIDYGDYASVEERDSSTLRLRSGQASLGMTSIYFPFRSLFTGRRTDELDFQIEDLGEEMVFKKKLPEGLEDYLIELPKDYDGMELAEIDLGTYDMKYFIPTIDLNGKEISVSFPKIKGVLSAKINPLDYPEVLEAKNCNQFSNGEVISEKVIGDKGDEKEVLRLTAEDANNCSASFYLPDLPHKYAYLISAESKNISGKPLLFWLENLTNRKADMGLYLDSARRPLAESSYLIQPPMAEDGLGYTLHFDNISIGREKTVNELGKITVYPIPYRFLTGLKMVKGEVDTEGVKLSNMEGETASNVVINHPNPAVYEVEINQPTGDNAVLVLSQAFNSGWNAYEITNNQIPNSKQIPMIKFLKQIFAPIFGEKIEKHVKVNNWENGWNISSKFKVQSAKLTGERTTIVLVFWPQYLEWLGFGLLFGCLTFVIARSVATWQSQTREKIASGINPSQ